LTTTILAVDDSRTLRKVFEIAFAGEPQFKVVVADSAQDALGKLHGVTPPPQIALIDVTLPDQNGYDLCGQIKSQSPSTAVVILSSKQVPYDQGRGAAAGADDFIDKPFDTQQLIDKVSKLSAGGARAAAPAPVAMPQPPPVSAQPQAPKAASAVPRPAPATAPASERHIKSVPPPKPKSSAPAIPAAAAAMGGGMSADQLANLGLSPAQVEAVMALSRDVVERVVWEVVPVLAETLIKEEIRRLTAE
jgi:CheY-like chemotaxis protein